MQPYIEGDAWKATMEYYVCMECGQELPEEKLIECRLCKECYCIDCLNAHVIECEEYAE